MEETEEQKAAWVKEELKKLKVEEEDEEKEGDLKVKQVHSECKNGSKC